MRMHDTVTAGISKDKIVTVCKRCKKTIIDIEDLLQECKELN